MKEEKIISFKLSNGKFVKITASVEERIDGLYIITRIGNGLSDIKITNIENPYVVSEK